LSTPALPYYPFHTLFSDPSLITAAVQSKVPAMLDQQVAALNFLNLHAHIGGYQAEFLRHFSTNTGSVSASIIPNIPSSQSQKSPGVDKSHDSSSVGNKGTSGLANPQCIQKPSTSLSTSISITPVPPSQVSVPCSTSTFSPSKSSKSTPSLQQKLQASQTLAKSASNRSPVSNLSPSVSKASPQASTSVAHLPSRVSISPYTPPKDQVLISPQPQKSSSSPNSYISLLKGGEGMLTAGVSITQVTSTSVNTTALTKPSTSKFTSFCKRNILSLQGNEVQGETSVSKTLANITPHFKDSHSDSSKMQGRSDCSYDIASKIATTLVSRSQSSGCKLSTTSATGPSIKSAQTQMNAISRSPSNAVGQDNSLYKETEATPNSSNPFLQRSHSGPTGTKNKSPENKDFNPSSIYKIQSGIKGSKNPATLRNIGHEITVTPSSTATSSISALSRLHQQSTELEVVTKPKSATLDLPVTIPSSITITAKQQGTSDGSFSSGQQGRQSSGGGDCFRPSTKKFKDSVSITEIGRKVSTVSQGANRMGGTSAINQKEQNVDEKHGSGVGESVEVITLE
jgi:hypothetical protein